MENSFFRLIIMIEKIVVRVNPANTLAITESPLKELCNFLIYQNNPEILNERARRQLNNKLRNIPTTVQDAGKFLGAAKCEKARKLYFDCTDTANNRSILIHNFNAQFWVHYFRNGIGLVSVTCFSHLASAEGSVLPSMTCTIDGSYEYQWFTHDLTEKYFQRGKSCIYLKRLSRYFIEQVNPRLICPYAVFSDGKKTNEPYKFVQGSLEQLKYILKLAFLVFEGIRRAKESDNNFRFNSFMTVTCGNLRTSPSVEHCSEWFLNEIGKLAIKENSPYTVLDEGYYRRAASIFSDWVRSNKHYIYLDFGDEIQNATPREKIVARGHLAKWLKEQGTQGEWIIKTWKLSEM